VANLLNKEEAKAVAVTPQAEAQPDHTRIPTLITGNRTTTTANTQEAEVFKNIKNST
jgi:hypothetical protein